MTLLERLEAAKAELANVKTAVEAGEKSADDLQNAITAVKNVQAQIDAADEAEALMKGLETPKVEKADKEVEEKAMPRTLGENFVEAIKNQQIGKKFDLNVPAFKAATDTQTSPAGAVDFATTFDKTVVEAARVPLVVRDLFGAENISGSTLVYLVEGAMQGAPAVTAEGAEKPQIHFADPTPKTVSLAKVACHIKESDEYINDYPFLASAINGRLLYELGLVEQNKLVTDLLATSGIQAGTYAANATASDIADAILQAAMDVQNSSGFAADAILINPADWYALRIAKDGEDRYYGGGFFGAQNVPNLWGINVCVSPAVAAGTIVVGAYKTCASVVQNGGVSVEAVNTNEDDFVKNLMTIRAEERLALAVRRPAGFKKLTKAS
jgi:HK97 family phage major capsid protein